MDYLEQPPLFKLRKVLRYLWLYGPARTYAKILGQLHLRRTYDVLPSRRYSIHKNRFIGLIGCGNYAFTTIAHYLNQRFGRVIAACAEYAISALDRGKHVYIEKPHVVSEDQLHRLADAMDRSSGKVFLGFNRPGSRFGSIITHVLDEQPGPGMYNWFVAGHDIDPEHWYFKPEEGGRVLGNLCHWTDFVLRLTGPQSFPIVITPTRAQTSDCDIAVTLTFADGSIAAITFSAKGHMFEGVRERFSAHKGDCLVFMDDFKILQVEVVQHKKRYRNFFRDHGHRQNIIAAAENVLRNLPYDRVNHRAHLWNTGILLLKTREALEQDRRIVVEGFAMIATV